MNNVTSSFSQSIHKREDFKRFKINDKNFSPYQEMPPF